MTATASLVAPKRRQRDSRPVKREHNLGTYFIALLFIAVCIGPVAYIVLGGFRTNAQITFDPTLPLFFPLPEDQRSGFRGKVKDPLDVARENGLDWRNFCRTQNSEEIRQRWETQKVALTQDWKRRHREAVKSRRRRGGGDGD